MSTNPEKEIEAFEKGRLYFDDPNCKNNEKYKFCIGTFNTAYWRFREKENLKIIITDKLESDKYLKNIIPEKISETKNLFIYYFDISNGLNIDDIKNVYKNHDVSFIKIKYKPSDYIVYKTIKGKLIEWHTLCLIEDDTIIFDVKNFGLIRDEDGLNQRVYRIKDKTVFQQLKVQFLKIIK